MSAEDISKYEDLDLTDIKTYLDELKAKQVNSNINTLIYAE